MTLQPGTPAFGAGLGAALDRDHPDDLEPDRGTLRGEDGEPVGRSDRTADETGTGPEPSPQEQAINEEALEAFVSRDRRPPAE